MRSVSSTPTATACTLRRPSTPTTSPATFRRWASGTCSDGSTARTYWTHLYVGRGTTCGSSKTAAAKPRSRSWSTTGQRGVAWAIDAGASAVLVSRDGPASDVRCPVISSLAELPSLLQTL